MHAAVHGAGGTDFVSKRAHLHGQMQAVSLAAKELSEKTGDPSILEGVRNLTRQAAKAERGQMQVMGDPKYLRYAQRYSHIPQEWMDAFNKRRAWGEGSTRAPAGEVSGKSFLDFERETLELHDQANSRLDAALKSHGEDGIDPEMGPLHPSSTSSWGTDGMFSRFYSELVSGVKNAARSIRGIKAKGLSTGDIPHIIEDYSEHLNQVMRTDGDKFYVKAGKDAPHFEGNKFTGSQGNPIYRVEDGHYVLLNQDGSNVSTPAQLEAWIKDESSRFASSVADFRNTGNSGGVMSHGDFRRKLPFLSRAHAATFQDILREVMGMDSKAAALEAHPPQLDAQVADLKAKVTAAQAADGSSIEKAKSSLNEFIGGASNAVGAQSILGRMMQQQGRLQASGSSGVLGNVISAVNDMMPYSYRNSLSIGSAPVAAQQVQALLMNAALTNQDPAMMARLMKNYGSVWFDNAKGFFTGEPGDLSIPHNKMRFDRLGLESFEKSSAMWNAAIEKDMEKRVGTALQTGDDSWLDMMYTQEEKQELRARMREDGTVNLSDEEGKLLANSVLGRHLETVNGMELPTSKPAAFYGENSKPFTMFMSTPAVITKSAVDLYRPGGMLHTGNAWVDHRGKALVTAALASQFAASNAVRSSALAKAVSLFTAGGWLPAATQAKAALAGNANQSEIANQQQQELLQAATMRLISGEADAQKWADDVIALAGVGITGAVPMKVVGTGDVIGSMAGSIDERVLGYPTEVRTPPGYIGAIKQAAKVMPAIGPVASTAFNIRDYLDPDRKYVNGKLAALFTRDESPLKMMNQYSPFLSGYKSYLQQKEQGGQEWDGVKTKAHSKVIGKN